MTLSARIIPTMLVRGRALVKGQGFKSWRSVGAAEQAARIYASRGVDELCILDVSATAEGRGPDMGLIEELTATCFSPIAVGGGIRSVDDVRALLRAGADKVVIGTAAFMPERLANDTIASMASEFGSQAIVVAVDVREGYPTVQSGKYPIATDPVEYARYQESRGAGEILLTSIERDGTMEGYDIPLIRAVSQAVSIPVIASGGCSGYEDMYQAIKAGASAVAAGALWTFTDATPNGAAKYLHDKGIEVRI